MRLTQTMVFVNVRGVEIDFPFAPYECQVTYMGRVIECLQEVGNLERDFAYAKGKAGRLWAVFIRRSQ